MRAGSNVSLWRSRRALSATLAFAPYEIFPALLFAYAALVLMLDGAARSSHPLRAGAALGWWFGFGFFLAGLYWVGYAFLVDADKFAWMIPFLAIVLPGGLALFFALAGAVCAKFWRTNWQRIFFFGAVFFAADWLQGPRAHRLSVASRRLCLGRAAERAAKRLA